MNSHIFFLSYQFKRPEIIKRFREFVACSLDYDALREIQRKQLIEILKHCKENVPYYSTLFNKLKFNPEEIERISDLSCLPTLSKGTIKENPDLFVARGWRGKIVKGSTGGSTGSPLKYLMSEECYARGVALLLRGWGQAGYQPGDRLVVVAGGSLVSNSQSVKSKIQDILTNIRHFSSYGLDDTGFLRLVDFLKYWRPAFLRGYATSLYLLARYMRVQNLHLGYRPNGIFSTAEVLIPGYRKTIEEVFETEVYDNYGLNDGGISAFECREHSGMHIDYERSILECVDNNGEGVVDGVGKLLATNLYNYAMPLIRYDTGDEGQLDRKPCPCGNPRELLRAICGRTTDYLKLNGKIVGSPVLTVLMGKIDLESYQIVQVNENSIVLNYMNNKELSAAETTYIENSFVQHVGKINIDFVNKSDGGMKAENKHKFIVNEVCR